ncbi:protein kinase [Myxococcus stipitatus]|uniref:serine/threonine-protein kinase n=1 Tax=Myxococcus stipitatus TaxID=83455 RepID=UPI001F23C14B|nr:serine/threonine-protein kinase [Myxococcus stipitatus]MCE9672021.1 protein kinase [Myxococcus stipitatus]
MSRPSDGDLDIDSVLRNTYKVVSLLGRGGMGSVYLAQHLRLPGKQVAVKVLRGGDHLTPEIFARFRREAEIASRLGHPNIVEVLDYDTLEDGTPFLVLEFLRGESLQARLERGRLPLSDVMSFARQMGSALQAAHAAGIVHRDLKPANVFLIPTDSGGVVAERLKLLDFGISKVLDSGTVQTQEATLIGTPQYMSPEQAQGRNKEIDARTDIFAFGCIVYEMMTGTPAFGAGGIAQMIFRVVYEPPEPLAPLCPEAPPHAIAAVDRALAKKAEERYPDVAAFVADLTGAPLQTLTPSAGTHSLGARASASPSGVALPSEGPPSLSSTLPPGSGARPVPEHAFDATMAPGTGRTSGIQPRAPDASGGTGQMGLVQPQPAAFASGGTGQMGLVQPQPAAFASGGTGQMGLVQPQPAALMDPPGLEPTLISKQVAAISPPVAAVAPHTVVPVPVPTVPPVATTPVPAAVVAPPPVAATPAKRAPVAAIVVAGLVVVAGVGFWATRPSGATTPQGGVTPAPTPTTTQVAANTAPAAQPTVTPTTAPANPGPGDEPHTSPEVAPPSALPTVATTTTNPAPPPTRPVVRAEVPEKLSDDVRKLLDDAERALTGGDTEEAIRLARSSQRREPKNIPQASYSLLTRAFCRQGDLSNAKAQWPKVTRAEQSKVRKYCKQHDIEL